MLALSVWSELGILLKGFHKDYEDFKSKTENAKRFTSLGESPLANTTDICELAAFTLSANILLNLDEVVNRE